MKKSKAKRQPLIRFLFLIYALLMLWLLFGRASGWADDLPYREALAQRINLTPLKTIRNYWYVIQNGASQGLRNHCIINLVGNVVLFIPIGFLLPRIWPKLRNFFLFVLVCTASILLVESVQLFALLGSFDVDDIILNLGGMITGYILCLIIPRKKSK